MIDDELKTENKKAPPREILCWVHPAKGRTQNRGFIRQTFYLI